MSLCLKCSDCSWRLNYHCANIHFSVCWTLFHFSQFNCGYEVPIYRGIYKMYVRKSVVRHSGKVEGLDEEGSERRYRFRLILLVWEEVAIIKWSFIYCWGNLIFDNDCIEKWNYFFITGTRKKARWTSFLYNLRGKM